MGKPKSYNKASSHAPSQEKKILEENKQYKSQVIVLPSLV
jgi:hypothetical protein